MKNFFSDVKVLFFLVLAFFGGFAFSQNIINPSKGEWANRQLLVLNLPDGVNAYYSLSGNDPESSGFAYDGPVLLDVSGDVTLKIAFISANGEKYTESVFYSVKEVPYPENLDAYTFVEKMVSKGMVDYTVGENFVIPESLEYSFDSEAGNFEQGKTLSLPVDTVLNRQVPLTVSDGKGKWRFVLRINPVMSGVFSRRDVPFEIENWEKITFTNKKLIYKIDEGWWEQPKLPLTLDRNVSHMISWQAIDFSPENPVRFFVLPPKPKILEENDVSGAKYIHSEGEQGYKFALIDDNGDISELYDSLRFDVFKGEAFSALEKVGIYYDSVYQGEMNVNVKINKKLPDKPVITSTSENGWSRKLVTVNIKNSPETELFVSVQGPVVIDENNVSSSKDVLFNFIEKKFEKSNGRLLLQPSNDGAVAYKVSAYAVDENQNQSNVEEFSVIIDTLNYYVDAEKAKNNEGKADGTKERPFSNFSELKEFADSSRFVKIYLNGEMKMPEGQTVVSSNMEILGNDNSKISFPSESSVLVRSSTLYFSNCTISYAKEKSDYAEEAGMNQTLFSIERGVFSLDSVEISANFGRNGTLINSDSSVITIKDSGLTSSASNYASCITSLDSKISIKDSNITTVSGTGVSFSCQGGIFELRKSNCSVVGIMGRVAELFNTHSSVTDNKFSADLKKSQGNGNAVYMDANNLSVEDSGNISTGF